MMSCDLTIGLPKYITRGFLCLLLYSICHSSMILTALWIIIISEALNMDYTFFFTYRIINEDSKTQNFYYHKIIFWSQILWLGNSSLFVCCCKINFEYVDFIRTVIAKVNFKLNKDGIYIIMGLCMLK